MSSFVVHFWSVFVLVLLRPVLGMLTATTFSAVRASVDRMLPHDLPRTTGDWLREQLARRGLWDIGVLTCAPDHSAVDAYFPGSQFIQLAPETWLRRDPVGWATGAHELGHALNYRRSPAFHGLLVCARWSSRGIQYVATAFILANLLYGSTAVAEITWGLLLVGGVMNVLVLWDELWASQVGLQMLREDRRMDTARLDGAWLTMGAAFLSYASGCLGSLALLLGYPGIARLETDHALYAPAEPLQGPLLAVVTALTAALLVRAALEVVRALRPPRYESASEAEVAMSTRSLLDTAWTVPQLVLLALLWNQPYGTAFVVAFMIASLSALHAVQRILAPVLPLLMLPLFVVLMPLLMSWVPTVPEAVGHSPLDEALVDEVRLDMERGHRELRAAQLALVNEPPTYVKVGNLVRVAYLPLLVVYWWYVVTGG